MDDFLTKKRDSGPILDLSDATVNTKEDFRKLFDRVPDFKIKPEKVRPEDIKIRDNIKKMKFKTGKKDFKSMKESYLFSDPIPLEMRSLKISELAAVPIDWKMLTSIRPKNKVDEEFYSRLIELKKLEQKTEAKDKRILARQPQIRRIKNKAGVVEYRVANCSECGEDFCTGQVCKHQGYDYFLRVPVVPTQTVTKPVSYDFGSEKKKKKKPKKKERKSRSPRKNKTKKRRKSKSPRKANK